MMSETPQSPTKLRRIPFHVGKALAHIAGIAGFLFLMPLVAYKFSGSESMGVIALACLLIGIGSFVISMVLYGLFFNQAWFAGMALVLGGIIAGGYCALATKQTTATRAALVLSALAVLASVPLLIKGNRRF
jgi:hypothetical protein